MSSLAEKQMPTVARYVESAVELTNKSKSWFKQAHKLRSYEVLTTIVTYPLLDLHCQVRLRLV